MKEAVLGYHIDASTSDDCLDEIFSLLKDRSGKAQSCAWLACMNPHSYSLALGDAVFREALFDSDWLVPDGVGVLLASRLLGGSIRERVTGSEVFAGLHARMNIAGGMSVFFLGATENTLTLILERMAKEYSNIRVAGTYSPPFKPNYSPAELDEMINVVNVSGADVLWVGMTAPKQEKWIFENRVRLNVKFAGAIGAVFDFFSGRVKRSHPIFQRLGLEWLPRLVRQPRRLWRRMFLSAPIFLWHVFLARVGLRHFDAPANCRTY
jgi:N-acetylglucosaminyldiphosphoundecaprenol N-acetyl-beta-D-mannosaminyltransferase